MRECIICNRSQPFYMDSHLTCRFTESNVIPQDQSFYCFPGADKRTRQLDVGRVRLLTSLTYSKLLTYRQCRSVQVMQRHAARSKTALQTASIPSFPSSSRAIAGLRCHPSKSFRVIRISSLLMAMMETKKRILRRILLNYASLV
jgi:hypothetical protein